MKLEIGKPISNQTGEQWLLHSVIHTEGRETRTALFWKFFLVHPNALRKGCSSYCGLYASSSHVQQHEENSIFALLKDHLVLYDTLWIKPKVTGRSFLKFLITTVKYCHGFIIQ